MIKVQDLSKRFPDLHQGEVVALDGVSFSVAAGEVFGLLGPNGAGKTTCLRLLSTVLAPTSGTASVDGCDIVTKPDAVRSRIGFLSGTTGLYDRMTARETVEYFGQLYGLDDDQLSGRIQEIFTTLSIHDFADTLTGRLSTGMRQKVSIARALIHDPPVLIFDEPTTGLDVLVARAVVDTVETLKNQGKSIVYSTHIMSEAERLCDRLAIIHRGRILAMGTLDELLASSQQPNLEGLFFELVSHFDAALEDKSPASRLNHRTVPEVSP
ncbi:MAG TPA: ABC transporter ATP-binding protein [Planctomycetaceae bacterium]|nr:ABC transporter ATP-binding protein [Planctomycetaceae bacterium]|tara:strand:+ start:1246 stop:2049 length:804 start_codon:yes stop_codon:yes gene_type:complete